MKGAAVVAETKEPNKDDVNLRMIIGVRYRQIRQTVQANGAKAL
jgi:hypothetical protein